MNEKTKIRKAMKIVELGAVCDVIAGQSPPSKFYNKNGHGIPFFQGKADFGELFPTVRYWTTKITKKSNPGDILFSVRAPVGPTNLNNVTACIGRGLAAIRVKTKVDSGFLLHYLRGHEKIISDWGTGSTFKAITITTLKSLQIPLPPLPVQRRIAAILDAADEHRRKTEALIEKYDELAQSVFLEMFGDPVRNENKFPKIKLSSLSKISSGSTPSRNVESYYKGNIPWVKTGEVDGGYITHTEEHLTLKGLQNSSCNIYPSNSILIAMYGQGKTRGKVAMITKEMTTNQACAVIEPSDKYNSKFLFYQLQLLYEDLRQLGRGGNQPNLNVGIIKNYEVLNPPIDLQSNFNSLVSNIEDQKISLIKSLEGSEALFQSLLQRAFRGELVTEEEEVVE